MNALRHGVDAQSAVIPGEDPAEFESLVESYRAQYRPSTPEEQFLVDTLVQSDWLRSRLLRIEAEMTNHLLAEMEPCANPLGALYCASTPGSRALERIRRHYEAADRAWFRASRELDRLRRQAADDLLFALPAPAPEPNWVRSVASPLPLVRMPDPAPAPADAHLALRL